MLMWSQSGISLSGSNMFNMGQTVFYANSQDFMPVNFENRSNKITLSIFRGRRFKWGTFALKGNFSYSINKFKYLYSMSGISADNVTESNIETMTSNLIPSLELWYIFLQKESVFIYTSVGSYGIFSDLNITSNNNENTYEYNTLIPFIRIGTQLNYGRFFINPFISFDLEGFTFEELGKIFENSNLQSQFTNYTLRSGLEFGIMF